MINQRPFEARMNFTPVRALLFDWGDTVMRVFPDYRGPMAHWPHVEVVPGIEEALEALHPRYTIALATNASDSDASMVRAALERAGLEKYFDAVFTSQELGARKPAPAFFQAALSRLGCAAGEVAMVGDSYRADVIGAREAGLWSVWFNPAALPCPATSPSHDAEVHTMAELPAALESLRHTDEHLLKLMEKYDGWLQEGKVPHVGQVLPVQEAFRPTQWILPTQQAIEILRHARTFALTHCVCRSHYRRCENPLETCLLINDMADALVEAGKAHTISLDEARAVLRQANAYGLVHQTAYNPEQHVWAVCSCCPCCCYRLQILQLFGRADLVVHSDYVAVVDEARCVDCGLCAERCLFGARRMVNGEMVYYPERCYGCGLCVTTCAGEAVVLELRVVADRKRSVL